MRRVQSIWRVITLALAGLVVWLALQGAVSAQVTAVKGDGKPKPTTGGGQQGSWALPYLLVAIGVGGGVFFVCRPSHRRDRARPEEYEGLGDVATGK